MQQEGGEAEGVGELPCPRQLGGRGEEGEPEGRDGEAPGLLCLQGCRVRGALT